MDKGEEGCPGPTRGISNGIELSSKITWLTAKTAGRL